MFQLKIRNIPVVHEKTVVGMCCDEINNNISIKLIQSANVNAFIWHHMHHLYDEGIISIKDLADSTFSLEDTGGKKGFMKNIIGMSNCIVKQFSFVICSMLQ